MKALITGASSGMGYDMALYLSELGYDLLVVARRKDRLELLKKEAKTNVQIFTYDLSKEENCYKLYEDTKNQVIDVLINNAGFGLLGTFTETDLNRELNMIDLNVKTLHILTKLYLTDMKKRDHGAILNVASSAGLCPGGPLLATYYATKAYVRSLTEGIYEELRRDHSHVTISALCPGPVNTEFNKVANVEFSMKGLNSKQVSKYAIDQMQKKKLIIIPGFLMKVSTFLNKLAPSKLVLRIIYHVQRKKIDATESESTKSE